MARCCNRNDDIDCAQAGQVVGAIDSVIPAATLVADMMDMLVEVTQRLGRIGGQVPAGAKVNNIARL